MKTTVPILPELLVPNLPDYESARQNDEATKRDYSRHYNRHHGSRQLEQLQPGDAVRLKLDDERKWTSHGTVIGPVDAPRSLNVQTSNGGVYRRNRKHLMKVPSLPVDTPELSAKTTTENHRDEATLSTELQNVATTATQPNDVHGNMSRDVYMTRSGRVVKGLLM